MNKGIDYVAGNWKTIKDPYDLSLVTYTLHKAVHPDKVKFINVLQLKQRYMSSKYKNVLYILLDNTYLLRMYFHFIEMCFLKDVAWKQLEGLAQEEKDKKWWMTEIPDVEANNPWHQAQKTNKQKCQ